MICGGVVSRSTIVVEQVAGAALPSETHRPIVFVPSGSVAFKRKVNERGGCDSFTKLVCAGTPFTVQITRSASPSGSPTVAATVENAFQPEHHSLVWACGQTT